MTTPSSPGYLLRAACVLSCLLTALASAAPTKFNIPAQPANDALPLFIKQANVQVMYVQDELKNVNANAVTGDLEPFDALGQLVKGTGFVASKRDGGWYAVVRGTQDRPGSIEGQVRDESGRPVPGARVTVSGTNLTVDTDRRGRFFLEDVPAGAQSLGIMAEGMQRTKVTDVTVQAGHRHTLSAITIPAVVAGITQLEDYVVSAKKNEAVIELDPYQVTDTKPAPFTTANIDITRTENDVLPFTTFSSKDIEHSGTVNLEDFLRTKLPQNFTTTIPTERDGASVNAAAGSAELDMRGWGSGETVVLLNGRRMPGRALSSSDTTPLLAAIRAIPLGSVERVEILPSAGSAIYGDNATGGVVNVVTKRQYTGGQFLARFDNAWSGSAPRVVGEFTYTTSAFANTRLRISGSASRSDPLTVGDRADWSVNRWRAEILQRDAVRIIGPRVPPLRGATTNIHAGTISQFGSVAANGNALFGPGTPFFTSVPAGYRGNQGLTPFLGRQGVYSTDLAEGADGSYSRSSPLGRESKEYSVGIGLDRNITGTIQLFLDYQRNEATRSTAGTYMEFEIGNRPKLVVPANAPTNPFGQSVIVSFDDPRLNLSDQPKRAVESTLEQFTASLRGRFGTWQTLLDYGFTRNKDRWTYGGFSAPVGGWREAFLQGRYNPFIDMRVAAPAEISFYSEYIRAEIDLQSESMTHEINLKASGPVARVGEEPVLVTAGIEWYQYNRDRSDWEANYRNSRTGQLVDEMEGEPSRAFFAFNPASRLFTADTIAGYGEAIVPLPERWGKLRVRRLEVFGSARIAEQRRKGFSDSDDSPISFRDRTTLYAGGLRWNPVPGLFLRSSVSVGVKPPLLTSGVVPSNSPVEGISVIDRRRAEEVGLNTSQYIEGGNPNLNPETTTSRNIGLSFQPKAIPGMRIAVDYVASRRNDAITSLSVQEILDLESDSTIGGRVARNPASGGDPNGVGAIRFVDARAMNLNEISSKSVDIAVDWPVVSSVRGRLVATVAASKNLSFKVQTSPTSPAIEQIGNPSAGFSRQLEWNGNGQVRWETHNWTVGWGTRYYDDLLVRPSDLVAQGAERAPHVFEHDVFFSVQPATLRDFAAWKRVFGQSWLTVGLRNVFNRSPRYWAAAPGTGYVSADSIVGRSIWCQMRREF